MPVADLSSGFRLYRREALAEVELAGRSYDVLIEALLRMKSAGFTIEEMPFYYRPRRKGSTLGRLLRTATSYLATLVRMYRLRNNSLSCDYDDRAYDSVIPLQRYWQRRRYRVVTGFAEESKLTLDIGCGSSRIARSMPHLIGLDVNLRPLRYLRRQGVLAASGSITRLPFRDGQFDQVICSEVIEHLPESVCDFAELARVVAPGGTLIIGTPDYDRWLWRLLERVYKLVLPEAHGKGHVSRYTAAKLEEKLRSVGIDVVERGGVFFGCQLVFKCVKREKKEE
jgi:SAM-dependent methyltransferase